MEPTAGLEPATCYLLGNVRSPYVPGAPTGTPISLVTISECFRQGMVVGAEKT